MPKSGRLIPDPYIDFLKTSHDLLYTYDKDTLFYMNYTGPHKILSFTKTNYATLIKIEYADSVFVTQIT